ncbi:MAG: GNAT family N-acetyltransferase [Chloroflexota bacterium]|nr:GNAT family N-acetyltransferase [Chloroflexota bacterium]
MSAIIIRPMTPADAEVAARHRVQMFADMGEATLEALEPMRVAFIDWAREALANGTYRGWCAEDDAQIVAGAGLMMLDWPPIIGYPHPHVRGHIVNVYTERSHRKRGIARQLMQTIIDHCQAQGIPIITLNASSEGQPVYEALGFHISKQPEMRLRV